MENGANMFIAKDFYSPVFLSFLHLPFRLFSGNYSKVIKIRHYEGCKVMKLSKKLLAIVLGVAVLGTTAVGVAFADTSTTLGQPTQAP
jgi:Phr family secreted Rap phosphatase inhibitor